MNKNFVVCGMIMDQHEDEAPVEDDSDIEEVSSVSSHSMMVNANRLQIHALAYNLFNWFRRLALAANMQKMQVDTIRLKIICEIHSIQVVLKLPVSTGVL